MFHFPVLQVPSPGKGFNSTFFSNWYGFICLTTPPQLDTALKGGPVPQVQVPSGSTNKAWLMVALHICHHWLFVLPMHLLCSSGRSSQAGSARRVDCLQEGKSARSYSISPSILLSSSASFCGVHTPPLPFPFERVILHFPDSSHAYTQWCRSFTCRVWRGQVWVCSPALCKLRLRPSEVAGGASPAATRTPPHQHSLKSPLNPQGEVPGDPRHQ